MTEKDRYALSNWEIFVWALDQLGGTTKFIDIEDIFLKCFEIAPERFAWRTRSDLPDYKRCSKALRDAEARTPRLLVKRQDAFRRQLTADGQRWVEANSGRLQDILSGTASGEHLASPPNRRMLAMLKSAPVFEAWKNTGELESEKWRYADLFKCSPDSDQRIWRSRLEQIRSAAHAASDEDALSFLEKLIATSPEWFGGSHE